MTSGDHFHLGRSERSHVIQAEAAIRKQKFFRQFQRIPGLERRGWRTRGMGYETDESV